MKRLKKISAALIFILIAASFAGCTKTNPEDYILGDFIVGNTYDRLIEEYGSLADTQYIYDDAGELVSQNTYYIEKTEDAIHLLMDYGENEKVYIGGGKAYAYLDGGRYTVLHFGYAYEEYFNYFYNISLAQPAEYSEKSNKNTISAEYAVSEELLYSGSWTFDETDRILNEYTENGDGFIESFSMYRLESGGKTLLERRSFEYGADIVYDDFIKEFKNAQVLHKVTLVYQPEGEDEKSEIYSVADGSLLFSSTGYGLYHDKELTDEWQQDTEAVTEDIVLYLKML